MRLVNWAGASSHDRSKIGGCEHAAGQDLIFGLLVVVGRTGRLQPWRGLALATKVMGQTSITTSNVACHPKPNPLFQISVTDSTVETKVNWQIDPTKICR